jgi:histidine triad (HIT) family protein
MAATCVFCQILAGNQQVSIVGQNRHSVALMDKYPVTRGHLLVIPRKHYELVTAMSNEEVESLFSLAVIVAKALQASLNPDGINIFQMNGKAAWQDFDHVHVHVVPRYQGDALEITWPSKEAKIEERNYLADKIRKAITETKV